MKKNPPLLTLLLISAFLVAAVGAVLKYTILEPLGIERQETVLEIPFVLMADNILADDLTQKLHSSDSEELFSETVNFAPKECIVMEQTDQSDPTEEYTDLPETVPPTEPEYKPVDPEWFEDVLFIGDSRTVGLKYIESLENADFFCRENMSVFTVRSWLCTDANFRKKNLEYVLKKFEYGKIYINLGLNECCTDHDKVMRRYQELVDMIRETEPDAVIILQAIMTVGEKKASDPSYSLERIQSLNERIKALAVDDHFRYVDVNEWIADENGYLSEELSFDGTHLYGTGYSDWADWIIEEAGWLNIP